MVTMKSGNSSPRAFTLVELLVMIAILAVLAAIQLPALANTKSKVQRIHCSDNLKRVGVAFRTWAENHFDRMPMQTSRFSGGAFEAVGVAATTPWTNGPPPPQQGVWGMFLVMSNELNTPKILYCPSDSAPSHNASGAVHVQATVFGPKTATVEGFQNDYNVSYFVGVDAYFTSPNLFLAGDHNLGTGAGQAIKTPQFTSAGTNATWAALSIGWQANNHNQQGNVLLTDGSVQNFDVAQLRNGLNRTGDRGRAAGVFTLPAYSVGSGVNRLQFP